MTKRLELVRRGGGGRVPPSAADDDEKDEVHMGHAMGKQGKKEEDEEEEWGLHRGYAMGKQAEKEEEDVADVRDDVTKINEETEGVRAALEEAFFTLLPKAMRRLTSERDSHSHGGEIFLFNNHYVVKPGCDAKKTTAAAEAAAAEATAAEAAADDSFGWHTDASEQLALCLTPEARSREYVSFWCPLDATSEANGTLVVRPRFEEPPSPPPPPSTDRASRSAPPADRSDPTDETSTYDEGTRGGGVAVDARPGDVVAFSSRLWHASGRNRSRRPRRVFYAQFSSQPLTDGSRDSTPISLAVPCGG